MWKQFALLAAAGALSLAAPVAAQEHKPHEHQPGEGLEGVTRPPARKPSGGSAAPS